MSIKLMAWAWETDLPQTEKMVLLCLCDHANDSGDCWPSVARLAVKCSVTDRTVQKAIQSLKDRGILSWVDAPGRTHRFTINPRTTFTPENCSPPKMTTQPPNDVHPTPERRSPEPSITIIEPSKINRGCRLPDDWFPKPLPSKLAAAVAGWPDGLLEQELDMFRDWAASASGAKGVKSNWDAAWRNWLRRVDPRKSARGFNGQSRGASMRDIGDEVRRLYGM
jgi:hypothetical protein